MAGIRFGPWKLDGANKTLSGVDPATYQQVVKTETTAGNLGDLASGGLAVKDTVAEDNGWTVGERVAMEFPRNGVQQVPLKAIYKDNTLNGDFLLGLPDYDARLRRPGGTARSWSRPLPGSPRPTPGRGRPVMAGFPNVTVQDQAEFRDSTGQADRPDHQPVLLAARPGHRDRPVRHREHLGLSIFERIRELGLLRAVGATRAQLRSMIRWEAVIIAVLGAVLGLAVGVFFGWTIVRA